MQVQTYCTHWVGVTARYFIAAGTALWDFPNFTGILLHDVMYCYLLRFLVPVMSHLLTKVSISKSIATLVLENIAASKDKLFLLYTETSHKSIAN